MKPGIYYDMPAAIYHADPADVPSLSHSIAAILDDPASAPVHAWLAHPRLGKKADEKEDYDKALAIGNASHKYVLGRGKDVNIVSIHKRETVGKKTIVSETEFMDALDFRTDEAKQVRDILLASSKVPMLAGWDRIARGIAASIRAPLDDNGFSDAFREGNAEVVAIAQCPHTGVVMRAMIDWMVDETRFYDLKTGETSASPDLVPMRMVDHGWDLQAAAQEDILDILFPATAGKREFWFVPVENAEPHAVTVHRMTEATMTMGRKKWRRAKGIWKQCMDSGVWPAYPVGPHYPEYPMYKEKQWLDREVAEAGREPFDPRVILAG